MGTTSLEASLRKQMAVECAHGQNPEVPKQEDEPFSEVREDTNPWEGFQYRIDSETGEHILGESKREEPRQRVDSGCFLLDDEDEEEDTTLSLPEEDREALFAELDRILQGQSPQLPHVVFERIVDVEWLQCGGQATRNHGNVCAHLLHSVLDALFKIAMEIVHGEQRRQKQSPWALYLNCLDPVSTINSVDIQPFS
ncbi:hypothetical protein HPB48_004695 [Haemaphysalis longicornis]|uniref:Uncharacterized protein n=1 Tax=Haemaphysalis longicornis TaxID=44386 RepID=A0A9J6G2W3_HAELO|nr:hypothetical protein HPB48_004695 [Haemaphysalis longicornis]